MLFSYCVIGLKGKKKKQTKNGLLFYLNVSKGMVSFSFDQPFITVALLQISAAIFMLTVKREKVKR